MQKKDEGERAVEMGSSSLVPSTAITIQTCPIKPVLPQRALLSLQKPYGWNSGKLEMNAHDQGLSTLDLNILSEPSL